MLIYNKSALSEHSECTQRALGARALREKSEHTESTQSIKI